MKLFQPSKPIVGEFVGHTPEEAMSRARNELGSGGLLRCWKARSGGIFGFFVKEYFVAGKALPVGANIQDEVGPRRSFGKGMKLFTEKILPEALHELAPRKNTSLSDLVEETSDEVSLGCDSDQVAVFSEVLAEAEATLSGNEQYLVRRERQTAVKFPSVSSPELIIGLSDTLASAGMPLELRPSEAELTLDGLVRSLAKLPAPKPVPTAEGSVIVVVGGRRDAHTASSRLLAHLGLEMSDLVNVEQTDAGRQRVSRRRSSKKVTVVVVEAPHASHHLNEAAKWIERLKPDYVLGAMSAAVKRSDVMYWRAQLGRIDALSLLSLTNTTTPGELMGEVPIAFLDGSPASTLRWVLLLLNSVERLGR